MKRQPILVLAMAFLFVVTPWACGLASAGSIAAWGLNSAGQCDAPAGKEFVAVAGGCWHSLALRSNGALVSWGNSSEVPDGNDFVAISCGYWHSLALRANGSLVAFGVNSYGAPSGNDFVAISAGKHTHSLALKSDGSIVAWGFNNKGQCNVPPGNDYVAISGGQLYSLALRSNGSLVAWGDNTYGQRQVPVGNNYVAIAAGSSHNLAIKDDGSLAAWGLNNKGQCNVPSGNDYVAIAAGGAYGLALKEDGTIIGWGDNSDGQRNIPHGNNYTAVSAGIAHSLTLVYEPPSAILVGFEIVGPEQVDDNSSTQYTAIASYDDGSTMEVTWLTNWSVHPTIVASIDEHGLLNTKDLDEPADITIYAQYSEGGVTLQAALPVHVSLHVPRSLYVPAEYPTIQLAIDASNDGDTVLVADGTYAWAYISGVIHKHQKLTVRSENGPENCIIDCQGATGFWFYRTGARDYRLEGFTFVNDAYAFGAIYCSERSSPIISNCIVTDNRGSAGIRCYSRSSPTISNCIITNNHCWSGGIRINASSNPKIINCIISDNLNVGIYCEDSNPIITNSTITDNWGGIRCKKRRRECRPTISNSILWANLPYELSLENGASVSTTYTNIQGGWFGEGNIDDDPLFINAVLGDYHLFPNSPCIDAGDNTAVPGDTADLDGDGKTTEPLPWDLDAVCRFVDHPDVLDTGNGAPPIVDIGAYEFAPRIEVPMKFTPQALNPGSRGKWVKAHFVLPEGFVVENVDANTPATLEPLGIESDYMNVFINEDGLVEIEIVFDRADFCGAGIDYGPAEVTVTGLLSNCRYFYGTDTIRIISNSLKYLGVLSFYWLEADCGAPDWCAGIDLDQNTVVDFIDFALFDGCCIEVVKD